MGIPLNDKNRTICAVGSAVVSLLCTLVSILILSVGAFIQVVIESKTHFIEGLETTVLPAFIMFIGIYGVIQNLICAVVHYKIRKEDRREPLSKFLLAIVISGILLCTLYLLVGIVCFVQIDRLDKAYGKGILNALKKYKKHKTIKYEVDMLQIVFDCCGSNDYRDWFGINWIDHNYIVNKKGIHMDSKIGYTNDDVPFSCCSATANRPCIHHHVHDNHVHYNYDYKVETTINRLGCKQALTTYYGNGILTYVGILILSSSFFQILIVLVTRLVQTSLLTAIQDGDSTDTADGYLFTSKFKRGKKGKSSKPLLEDNSSGEDSDEDMSRARKKTSIVPILPVEPIYDEINDEPIYANIGAVNKARRNSSSIKSEPIYANVGAINKARRNSGSLKDEPIYANVGAISKSRRNSEDIYANAEALGE
ncbi:peripherin-2-like [Gigantopelta aegis]|uniref:peripherin-2-like n=1 Tax=Gigantopelta aegis TaxID=1735272 RepID=UPI001B88C2E0|nr:peripherin-2-like [Gigantopelta aegis]